MHRGECSTGAGAPGPGRDRGGWEAVCGGGVHVREGGGEMEGNSLGYLINYDRRTPEKKE